MLEEWIDVSPLKEQRDNESVFTPIKIFTNFAL